MANLSKERRDKMLSFLNKLKEEHKTDDNCLIALGEIESALTAKKYGLVWEEHEEEVDKKMVDNIPVFIEDETKEIISNENEKFNFILEGDNLHSLYLLEKTHKGRINIIYIDPPYNTGNSFTYDDAMVGDLDGFKHSKWLSFMEKRLRIARKLLADDGIIWISIDENELADLKMLCDEIFDFSNFRSLITVIANPGGRDYGGIAKTTEYILVYAKTNKSIISKISDDSHKFKDVDKFGPYELRELRNRNTKFNDGNRPNLCYPFFVDPNSKDENNLYSVALEQDDKHTIKVMPLKSQGIQTVWRWGKEERARKNLNTNIKAKQKKDGSFMIVEKYRDEQVMVKNILSDKKFRTENGSLELKEIFSEKVFDYPKPVEIPKLSIETSSNQNAIILDFFAGSGTTAQAVMELNQLDNGHRSFILCTNNENSICESITYPRCKTVITGIRKDGSKYSNGIPSNLKYYKTGFVEKKEELLSDALLNHIKEMVQLEHMTKIDGKNYILLLDDDSADNLEKHWNEYSDLKGIYISKNVLLTSSQDKLFNTVEMKVIPDYYFNFELKEAGESW